MKEYESIITGFSNPSHSPILSHLPREDWCDQKAARAFLEKYWLEKAAYDSKWKSIMEHIFQKNAEGFPGLHFREDFKAVVLKGGCLFEQEDHQALQCFLRSIGSEIYVVLEDDFGSEFTPTSYRMQFPVGITWSEMMSGNYASVLLLSNIYGRYFVFSENDQWGLYCDNDSYYPTVTIGVSQKYVDKFLSCFERLLIADDIGKDWIPKSIEHQVIWPARS